MAPSVEGPLAIKNDPQPRVPKRILPAIPLIYMKQSKPKGQSGTQSGKEPLPSTQLNGHASAVQVEQAINLTPTATSSVSSPEGSSHPVPVKDQVPQAALNASHSKSQAQHSPASSRDSFSSSRSILTKVQQALNIDQTPAELPTDTEHHHNGRGSPANGFDTDQNHAAQSHDPDSGPAEMKGASVAHHQNPYHMLPLFHPPGHSPGPSSAGSGALPQFGNYQPLVDCRQHSMSQENVVFGSFDGVTHSPPTPRVSTDFYPSYLLEQYHHSHYNPHGFQQHAGPPLVYTGESPTHRPDIEYNYNHQSRPSYEFYSSHNRMPSGYPSESYSPFTPSDSAPELERPLSFVATESVKGVDAETSSEHNRNGNHHELNARVENGNPGELDGLQNGQTMTPSGSQTERSSDDKVQSPVSPRAALSKLAEDASRAGRVAPKAAGRLHNAPPDNLHQSLDYHRIEAFPERLDTYLLSMFGKTDLADFTLELRHTSDSTRSLSIPVHSLIVARSPRLKALMSKAQESEKSKHIMLETSDRFIRPEAFRLALQSLYGSPLFDLNYCTKSFSLQKAHKKTEFALAYAAAGHLLDVSSITAQGVKVVSDLLQWDTVDLAIAFATEGVYNAPLLAEISRHASERQSSKSPERHPPSSESSCVGNASHSATSSSASSTSSHEGLRGLADVKGAYGAASHRLLFECMDFITHNFPADFVLSTTIGQSKAQLRFPAAAHFHLSASEARPSTVQFGDQPRQRSPRSTPMWTAMSRVLLSLPFELLKLILESLELGSAVGGVDARARERAARSIIAEREQRRRSVLQGPGVPYGERRAHASAWANVGWQESVTVAGCAGTSAGLEALRVTRRWRGFRDPREKSRKR
ncbi:MAG: hypothetical protein M1825_000730 [Sarcosagium campestre]|nr:MAG: hypothetical protein M1825_000730 [Sarcosagium campestre]